MPEGNDQNLNQNNQEPTGGPNFPSQESGSSYTPQSQNNGSIDGINGGAHPVEEVNLSPNQITPNLAREGGYFEEHSNNAVPQGTAPQSGPEMQYPSYNEESESSFSPKLIIIIIVVGIILLGSVFGIITFFKSRNTDTAQEEITITEENPDENTSEEQNFDTDTDAQTPAATPTPAPVVTPLVAPAPVETPIVAPQPEEKIPDTTGAVEGSG
ncbi:hypothetical protein COY62_02280 [bacterium (Candidatus Howlettbacteria) CG_4_10_14_0_8_um_filter_40_9]|nr:MAG: hypothetical protein COY62_02280 [bacterium (Candidatus Howlettbacteria) CG_4_10_14_0_8_um_filter_40_9]